MFRFNLLLAVRTIIKNKVTSAINFMGLSIAFSVLLLILLYLTNEISYDRYHEKADRIYRVTREAIDPMGKSEIHFGSVNFAFAEHISADFSQDVESIVRLNYDYGSLMTYNDKSFVETKTFYADSNLFEVFSWKLIKGNSHNVLKEINSVAISESVARKYFGNEESIGKIITMEKQTPLLVTGVFEDIPSNTHMKADMFISMRTREMMENRSDLLRSQSNNDATYLLLRSNAQLNHLESNLSADLDLHYEPLSDGRKSSQAYRYHFWPLKDIHLYFPYDSTTESNGNYVVVYIFSATAFLILLIACINFINLSIARLSNRAKEVGLKKTIGAMSSTLFAQFITETFLFAFSSMIMALLVAYLTLPLFNSFLGTSLDLAMLTQGRLIFSILVLILIVSFIAGGYPAYILSSVRASEILKKGINLSWRKLSLRSALVGVQFFLAFFLIISMVVIKAQLDFVSDYNLGFNKNSLLVMPSSSEIFKNFKLVKERLEQFPGISKVTLSSRVPSGRLADAAEAKIEEDGKMKTLNFRIADILVDHDYFKVLNIPIAAGRGFDYALPSDSMQAFILNETAVKAIGWKSNEEAVGKIFHYGSKRKGSIVGVVKDFNFESLKDPFKPTVFVVTNGRARSVVIRIDENQKEKVLAYLTEQWARWRPDFPFTFFTLSDNLEKQYDQDRKVSKGITFFAGFCVLVSSLGVFGLALLMAEQRTKEMGIRKVLGAGVMNVMLLLSKWFFILIVIAAALSFPVSYWL